MKIDSLGSLLKEHGHADALELKTEYRTTDPLNWYQQNGYYRLAESYRGDQGWGGISVNPASAMRSTAVFACTKIIAEDVGSLPLFLYKRSKDGTSREKATKEPLYRVMHDVPNEETSAVDLRGAMTAHAVISGDGYSRIVRRKSDGKVIAWWLLQPEDVRTDRKQNQQRVFIHKEGSGGQEKTYEASEILHLTGFGWNGVCGYNVVKQFRSAIGLGLTAEEYASRFFANDATPGVVLKTAERLSPEGVANMKAAWIAAHKERGVAVAHSGLEVDTPSFSPNESQFIEQRIFQLLEVCRIFRMPPHKLAELTRATFSNIEQQSIEYYTNTLRPWLVRWEQAINRCCLTVEEAVDLYAEHAIEGLLRGDFRTQTDGFARLLQNGVYSINEVRAMYNLNPIEGGDEHFIQLNMQDVIAAAQADPNQDIQQPAAQQPAATGTTGKPQLVRVKGLFQ
jgi:HK97 family phage portal protein